MALLPLYGHIAAMQHGPSSNPVSTQVKFTLGFKEFVALVAALMATNALSIDPMLPALPDIGRSLAIASANDRQWIITTYFIGLGIGSLFYGSLSDRYGRKRVLAVCMAFFIVATLFCMVAQSFAMMLAGRAAAGFFAAASRVIAVSIVRDRFQGDAMARVMSLIFLVFMIVPVLAPAFGQAVLLIAPWRWIFAALAIISGLTFLWMLVRLPETLSPQNRVAIRVADLRVTLRTIATHRSAVGYMAASGVVMGGLVGFITSVQQIFFDVFHDPVIFPLAFAGVAGTMAVGSLANSHLVERIGARRLSQGALVAMIFIAAIHSGVVWSGRETMATFIMFQGMTMFSFSLTGSNFSAISMEPFARGAGLAASFQACLTTSVSALLGAYIGAQFDGTTLPLALGFLATGILALLIIFWAERGRLFTRPGLSALRQETPPLP